MSQERHAEHRPSGWTGNAIVQPGCVALDVSVGAHALHAHHAWQVMLAPGGVEVEDALGDTLVMECAVIPPNRLHRVGAATRAWMVYIDPAHACMHGRVAHGDSAATWKADILLHDLLVDAEQGAFDVARLLARLGGAVPVTCEIAPTAARAVHEAMRLIRAHPDDAPALGDVARAIGVSPRTLSKAFIVHAGLPFRRYIRWQRLVAALAEAASGASLTQAAHEAGFHDSAHLHHAFQQFFGIAPSLAMRDIRWPASPLDWWSVDGADSV